jgi:hypothetical protein
MADADDDTKKRPAREDLQHLVNAAISLAMRDPDCAASPHVLNMRANDYITDVSWLDDATRVRACLLLLVTIFPEHEWRYADEL